MKLKKVLRAFSKAKNKAQGPCGEDFDINHPIHAQIIQSFYDLSKCPMSIVGTGRGRGHGRDRVNQCSLLTDLTTRNSSSEQSSHPASGPKHSEYLFPIGSFTKNLTALVFIIVFYEKQLGEEVDWTESAIDLYNRHCERRGHQPIKDFGLRNPTILELLLHKNAFASIKTFLLAHDETFIGQQEHFLETMLRETEVYFTAEKTKNDVYVYSEANYIFATLILEVVLGEPFHEIADKALLGPLKLLHTAVDGATFAKLQGESNVALTGHRISADMKVTQRPEKRTYLSDMIEGAAFGARSCMADLMKLHDVLLDALQDKSDTLFKQVAKTYFHVCEKDKGCGFTLAGLQFDLDTDYAGCQSLNADLCPEDEIFYRLGTKDGESVRVHYKGGIVDGFTLSVYVSVPNNSYVIVLSNATGPIDMSCEIAHYVLQEMFSLEPKVDFEATTQHALQLNCETIRNCKSQAVAPEITPDMIEAIRNYEGTYICEVNQVRLKIEANQPDRLKAWLSTVSKHETKESSEMEIRLVGGQKMQLFPGVDGFGHDTWSVFKDPSFEIRESGSEIKLVAGDGRCFYRLRADSSAT